MKNTNGRKKQGERGAENKRRIYMKPAIYEALQRLCGVRNESVSGVLTKKAIAHIRTHAPLLRKHNFPVPEEVFAK